MAKGGSWPGRSQREPSRGDSGWSIRRPIADWLRREGAAAAGMRVLDVGCGTKPYRPFFAGASEYVGIDVPGSPDADVHGFVEELPLPDASFDVVLCIQVLEHVDDPAAAVRELRRVTRPGGRVLASTHGVMGYHPSPNDYWRWTHTGLARLFEANGPWATLDVAPGAGSTAALGLLVARYVHLLAKRGGASGAARPVVAALNTLAAALDARVALLREPVPGSLFANFHVTAVPS